MSTPVNWWLGMVFPALIVVLSMTTDHILDHAPSRGIDVATFRDRERKRVDILQVRLDTERALLKLETEMSTLRRNREQVSGHARREWVFWNWLRPMAPVLSSNITEDPLKVEIDQAVQTLRSAFEERFEDVCATVRTLDTQVNTWTTQVDQHLSTLRTQIDQFQEQVSTLNLDDGTKTGPGAQGGQGMAHAQREQEAAAGSGRTQTAEGQDKTASSRAETGEQGNAAELILVAFQRLGANTPDTWIAREVGCSRKTVARWRKRYQEQGRLSAAAERELEHVQLTETPG